jgi:hypothetical protein
MEINRSAPAVASSEIEVAAPPEVAWAALTDFERWPDFGASWISAQRRLRRRGGLEENR